jgi:hypothetical protein
MKRNCDRYSKKEIEKLVKLYIMMGFSEDSARKLILKGRGC